MATYSVFTHISWVLFALNIFQVLKDGIMRLMHLTHCPISHLARILCIPSVGLNLSACIFLQQQEYGFSNHCKIGSFSLDHFVLSLQKYGC